MDFGYLANEAVPGFLIDRVANPFQAIEQLGRLFTYALVGSDSSRRLYNWGRRSITPVGPPALDPFLLPSGNEPSAESLRKHDQGVKAIMPYNRKRKRTYKKRFIGPRKKRVYKKRRRTYRKRRGKRRSNYMTLARNHLKMQPMKNKTTIEANVYNHGSNGEMCLIPLGQIKTPFQYTAATTSTGHSGNALIVSSLATLSNYCMYANMKCKVVNQCNWDAWIRPVRLVAKQRYGDSSQTGASLDRYSANTTVMQYLKEALQDHYDATDDALVGTSVHDTYKHESLCYPPGMDPLSSSGAHKLFYIKRGGWMKLSQGQETHFGLSTNKVKNIDTRRDLIQSGLAEHEDIIIPGSTFLYLEIKGQIIGTDEADSGGDEDRKNTTGNIQIAVETIIQHGYKRMTRQYADRDFEDLRGSIGLSSGEAFVESDMAVEKVEDV